MKKAYMLINYEKLFAVLLLILGIGNLAYSQQTKVVINEINYRSTVIQQDIDFIELYNADIVAVDLTGWQITGGVSYQFPAGTVINSGTYLVIAGDPTTCQSVFSFSGALGPYTGKLSGDGEDVELRDPTFCEIDKVDYDGWQEWPDVRFNDYTTQVYNQDTGLYDEYSTKVPTSIQKINPILPGQHGGSWSADLPTPKASNTGVYLASPNNIPVIKSVSKTPNKPTSGEEVRIKADMANIDNLSGTLSVNLEYQIVNPGSYIHKSDPAYANTWTILAMQDNGIGADSTANNGVYTAAIPQSVQSHRRLIRYRVKVSTSTGYNNTYPDQNHIESNYAYYVYDGYPLVGGYNINALDPLQDVTVITGNTTADTYIGPGNGYNNDGQYTGYDYLGEGTLVYNGKVYDHIRFRPRGRTGGRSARYKPGIKFDMNAGHTFAPLDDCGNEYDEKRGKLVLSGTYVNDITTHGLTESLIHKTMELTGGTGRGVDYTQLRIVSKGLQSNDFWGVFLIMESFDGDYLKQHNHPDGNIWRYKDYRLSHQGDFPGSDNIAQWPGDMTKVDWDLLLGDKVANQFFGNGANNYEGKHSQRDYYNPETDKWHIWYGDYDTSFGMSFDDGSYHQRSSSDPTQTTLWVQNISSNQIEYRNQMRSAYDLLFSEEQIEFLVDTEAAKIYKPGALYDWTTVDKYRWNQYYDLFTIGAQIDWYKDWFEDRKNHLLNQATYGFNETDIPTKPVISLTGTTALDDLTFSNSAFSDNGSFAALEWRVGEWSDPANPVYQNICEPKYEIESVWESGEITSFSNSFTIPGTAKLKAGRTYKIRVRYKDNVGKWSYWSNAVKIVPTPANNNTVPSLVINEIMYNPDEKCGSEFVEIKNIGNNTVALDGLAFTDGIEYNFPAGTIIGPSGFIVLARDSITFYQRYGFYPFGDYSGSLDNNGERLELRGLYNRLIDSLTYNNKNPWDEMPDGGSPSLELLSTSFNNANALSWFRSDGECGTPGSENSRVCSTSAVPIVINEINYNAPNSPDAGDWVELHNTTSNAIDISDWEFYDNGNQYIIPQGTVMQPDSFLILAQNDTLFTLAFPHVTDYVSNFDFNLSGGGERISLFDDNKCLSDYVVYDDDAPWDTDPDGNGPSLSLITPNSDNADPASWESSANINSSYGTPGRPNEPCLVQQIVSPDTLCVGDMATLTPNILSDETTYSWFLSGATTAFATTESVSTNWLALGTYNIQLVAKYYECTKIYTRQIVIIGCNTPPILTSDNYTVQEDVVLDDGFSLLSNDASDPEGDNIAVSPSPVSPPSNGSVTLNSDGTFIYTPNPNFNGGDAFEYEVCDDGFPIACNTEMVYIVVTPVNDAPTTVADYNSVDEDVTTSGNFKNNDTDLEGNNLILTADLISESSNGTVSSFSTGFYVYTPNPDFNGVDSFSYEVCDDGIPSLCDTGTVVITIEPVNDEPVAVDDLLYTTTDSVLIVNVLINDTDVDGDMLVAEEDTGVFGNSASNGTVTLLPNGDLTYEPDPGFSGTDDFDYEICDPDGLCSTATVTVIVEPGCVDIELFAWLEGPYNENTSEMNSNLTTLRGLLPGQTPVNSLAAPTPAGQPYYTAPWNYTGTEGEGWTDDNYERDEVDWVLVSFREGIEKNTELAQTAALIKRDGSISFPNGCVLTTNIPSALYVVIEHRNHVGVMSPTPVDVIDHTISYDFRSTDSYKDNTSSGQKQLSNGAWVMFAGDGDQSDFPSYDIRGTDKTIWLNANGVFQQYLIPDYDLSGDVNGADKVLWDANNGVSSRVPR